MSLLPKNAGILEFKILDHLGSGGFANTYLARDENLDKEIAIKEFFPRNICERGDDFYVRPKEGHEATFQTYLTHFLAEAQILARFDEPNVVKVLRYFEALGTAYIIMEFVEGRHLDDFIQETDFITEETVTDWLEGILTGLHAIHANDIIHGDIKPKNIIINSENQPVLIDFGASVIYQAKKDDGELYDEVFVSPNYAAPEQLSGAATIDHRVDIFALGAVFFEVITREKFRPAETSSAADILNYSKFYDAQVCPNGTPRRAKRAFRKLRRMAVLCHALERSEIWPLSEAAEMGDRSRRGLSRRYRIFRLLSRRERCRRKELPL